MLFAKLISKPNLTASLDKGIVEIIKNKQIKSAVPMTEQQTIEADAGYELEKCIVEPIPEEYVIPNGEIEITANGEYDVKEYEKAVIKTGATDKLQWKCDNMKTLRQEFSNYKGESLDEVLRGLDTSQVTTMEQIFANCINLTSLDLSELDTSNVTNMHGMFQMNTSPNKLTNIILIGKFSTISVTDMNNMFYGYYGETLDLSNFNTSNVTNMYSMFNGCKKLKTINVSEKFNTSKVTSIGSMFRSCTKLENPFAMDTSNVTSMDYTYSRCSNLKTTYNYDVSNATSLVGIYEECLVLESEIEMTLGETNVNMNRTFYYCHKIPKVTIHGSENVKTFDNTFHSCYALTELSLNLINATSISRIVTNTTNMTNLDLKNIKLSLQIGSGNQYGHLLTLDSLLNTIKELWNNTDNALGGTKTLTIGSVNLEKIANVYVKLIDITDEMRAEDEYIDNKLPFEVCESTDEGAMTIQEYITSKNWQLA